MLTELKKATDAKQPIVVTMWQPFWANNSFPIRALKDPKGSYGQPEGMHAIARQGFSNDHSEVATMMSHLKLTDEQFSSLDDLVSNQFGAGHEEEAVKAWLDQNPDIAPALEQHLKS